MKIRSDLLHVSTGALNTKGERLEPEEQAVRREIVIDAEAKLGAGPMGQTVGSIPASIIVDQTAGEIAAAFRSMCGQCKHFRNDLWLRDLTEADSPASPVEKRRVVNKIRAALLTTQNAAVAEPSSAPDGDFDVEHSLRTLGYCKALYEFFRSTGASKDDAMTLVHPASTCPEDVRKNAPPDGFFEQRPDAKRGADAAYDVIMKRAQGKL